MRHQPEMRIPKAISLAWSDKRTKLLKTINNRIELLIDKDHKIGHSYFLKIKNKKDLITVFKDEVIPLLEEYFFGDFGKIGLVLGNTFIDTKATKKLKFANFDSYDSSIKEDLLTKEIYKIKHENEWNFVSIYKNNEE